MRRLDRALDSLAERGDPIGPELLIGRINSHLAGEPDLVVVRPERRGAMVMTEQRPTYSPPPPRRRAPAIALASFLAIVIAVLTVWLVAGSGDDQDVIDQPTTTQPAVTTTSSQPTTTAAPAAFEPGAGIARVEQYVAALRAGDLSGLVVTDPIFAGAAYAPDFEGWLIGLNAAPEVVGCGEAERSEGVNVTCAVSFGEEFFFSQVAGVSLTTTLEMRVLPDGTLTGLSMQPPSAVVQIEGDMRAWVRENYPDLEIRMFGPNVALMTREAGELHMQLLDEYLAARHANDRP